MSLSRVTDVTASCALRELHRGLMELARRSALAYAQLLRASARRGLSESGRSELCSTSS